MRPRYQHRLTSEERAAVVRWWLIMLPSLALLVLATMAVDRFRPNISATTPALAQQESNR